MSERGSEEAEPVGRVASHPIPNTQYPIPARDSGPWTLRVEGVEFAYAADPVLAGVSFEVAPGEFVGLIGPNGSGKSTLIRVLSRGLRPRLGRALLDGRDVWALPAREVARHVAVVAQEEPAQFDFTALEVVLLGRSPHLGRLAVERPEDVALARAALEWSGTAALADRFVTHLSGGERQRVALARALAQQARLLLLDEPTSHLDLNYQIEMLERIRALGAERGTTVLAVLHDLNLAATFCDRLLLLAGGRVTAAGTPWQVLTPDRIHGAYGAEVLVRPDPRTARPHIFPMSAIRDPQSAIRNRPVHVFAGAGCGGPVIAALVEQGFAVTTGAFPEHDPDAETARALGVPAVAARPFCSLDSALEEHAALLRGAAALVIAPTPVGPLNWRHAQIVAASTLPRGQIIVIDPEGAAARDIVEGEWTRLVAGMIEEGASRAADAPEAARMVVGVLVGSE